MLIVRRLILYSWLRVSKGSSGTIEVSFESTELQIYLVITLYQEVVGLLQSSKLYLNLL